MEKINLGIATLLSNDNGTSVLELNFYSTFICIMLVLILGRIITKYSSFLRNYDIPEPVTGGIIVAFILFLSSYYANFTIKFAEDIKTPLLLAFYATVGLSADFDSIKKGGKLLITFSIAVFVLLVVQNAIGVGVMSAMGENPLIGLLGGSITLSGGHGTGAAWGATFQESPYNFAQATDIAMACATYGLISGGLIGGPMANYLIKKFNLKSDEVENNETSSDEAFTSPQKVRLITSYSFITSLSLIALALVIGNAIDYACQAANVATNKEIGFLKFLDSMPTFVWCLFSGIIIRNGFSSLNIHKVFDREVGVIGNVALSLFLAMSIMTLNIVELIKLAVPISVLLIIQTIAIIIYVRYVTFVICGKNYAAACLVAGHCGFGMGATPTAIANLQAVTNHFGPCKIAFIIVPIMGGFLVDIVNALVVNGFVGFLF
ncbi:MULTISPECIES: sodium/glutamate symporter [unclassified Campylobacter]|uniref:sodium/glutamate symporter n=1 Tax=unclassified Campylobacter TaxID=2593542 RepID=UPI001DF5CC04|nr:sodium/glutamate symporter [Campylobacter sp. RM12651]MBZ7990225.1 sodium/glutamate symporter [Campylobacter sp. RM9331]MBZ8004990.1 sodium/glutamate symporter [Campylobacter sp. RM9332]ULO02980.1 sodium:glutamate symport carrier protein [Campylobacter sp. RM12651]